VAPTELTLRPAAPTDLPAIADLHIAAREASYPAMPHGIHPPDEARAWVSGWDLSTYVVWVAESDALLGYARFDDVWLDDLYVTPTQQGTGVGSALLDLVKAQRPAGFCLWVFESNEPARSFYRGRGLVELEHTDGSANEEQAPDLRMAWPGTDPLAFYRGLIDAVDVDLGDLLNRRAALTAAVQRHKGSTERDPARERQIARALAERAPILGEERAARIVHAIITESLDAAGS
jgi:chorismate mutase/ribosomal protein S18 acetylase RimI-like enzyme